MFFLHGSIHSRGIYILINPTLNCIIKNIHNEPSGRIILIDLNFNAKNRSFYNVYAPNNL